MPDQGFRHFQANVAATDHDSFSCVPAIEDTAQLYATLQGVNPAYFDGVSAGEVRTDRYRTGGEQELAIGFPPHAATLQVADAYLSSTRIDLLNFVENSDIDSFPLPEPFRSADNERIFPVDNPADIVGNPSGGK